MLHIRPMTAADVPLGMRLKQQASWNQTEADWRRFLELEPNGCFVADLDRQSVATLTTCLFGPVAWIAMVLVDAVVRGRGIGTALMTHALEFLDEQGVQTVRLDATPLGQPLYEKLGFVAEYTLARHEGIPATTGERPEVQSLAIEQLDRLAQLDRAITGTDRRKLLVRLAREQPQTVRVVQREGELWGFAAARRGARAWQIGPCLALGDAGPLLLADAWHRYAGQAVFIDVPAGNTAATALVEAQELKVQRHLLRMSRGMPICERVEALWASSGPEKG